ncbi:MAG: cytochrome P460 family protein [Candidatus Pacebacteria bacterium]|nr:cytochrome P460 family protein [Candidatus Paceibacterota bacterium]NUQ57109.1 cytochrome P460 family protein [Candidatus Paceibacter sp.]
MKRGVFGIISIVCIFSALWMFAGCASSPTHSSVSVAKTDLAGYRDWTTTVSRVVMDKSSPFYGFQRVLVNDIALPVYKSGGSYPEGSVLILEFNEPMAEGNDTAMGKTNWLAVMTRDSAATQTGGWIFSAVDGKTMTVKADVDPVAGCYNCHTARKDNNYIFSRYSY